MVIINAGCQGHAGDPAAAWLPQLILPAEALCLLTALPMPVSVERMACMEKTRSRDRNHSASCYSFSILTLSLAVPVCAKSPPLWASCFRSHCASIGQLTGSHGAWGGWTSSSPCSRQHSLSVLEVWVGLSGAPRLKDGTTEQEFQPSYRHPRDLLH